MNILENLLLDKSLHLDDFYQNYLDILNENKYMFKFQSKDKALDFRFG
jgi:hypothetical protein